MPTVSPKLENELKEASEILKEERKKHPRHLQPTSFYHINCPVCEAHVILDWLVDQLPVPVLYL